MTDWAADSLLPGHSARTIALADEPTYGAEPDGSLVATLIRREPCRSKRAVLYIHGWSDYFFQVHLGEEFEALGYDFHAIDLRRYGRSLRPGHLAGYVPDLEQYFVELDQAMECIRSDGHESIVLAGHSTGGLTAALYAHARPGSCSAVVLNSPWIEFRGAQLARLPLGRALRAVSALSPTTALPTTDAGFYHRTIAAEEEGEWTFDHSLKGAKTFAVRVGWLRAVLAGQARVAAGLAIDAPVLVVASARSGGGLLGGTWSKDFHEVDAVLDVRRIAERAHCLGSHVTLVRIDGALHDVVLSAAPVRRRAFDELGTFLRAYDR